MHLAVVHTQAVHMLLAVVHRQHLEEAGHMLLAAVHTQAVVDHNRAGAHSRVAVRSQVVADHRTEAVDRSLAGPVHSLD